MEFLRKYNTATHVYIPIVKRAVVDFAVGADWTPAAGDVKISKDGGAAANIGTLPTAIAMGNTAYWDFTFTATEMQAAKIVVTVADSATKVVEDQAFIVATYGNASAQHAVDFSDAVRLGLTALPNANAEAAGGLYTRGSGAGQINQQTNGQIDANVERWRNAVNDALSSGKVAADVKLWLATAPAVVTANGYIQAAVLRWLTDNAAGTPNALVSSRVDTSVGAMANAVITAAAHAAGAIDANAIATDAIGAAELAADAVAEIQSGLSTLTQANIRTAVGLASANLDTQLTAIDDFIDTEVAAIKAKTDNLPASPAATGDAMTLTVGERAAVADKLLGRTRAGGADGGRTVAECLAFGRNKWAISAGVLTVYADDDTTPLYTAAVVTAAGDPVVSLDPV